MARPSTVLVIFFVAFNGIAGMMMAQGIAEDLGVDAEVGGDDEVAAAEERTEQVDTGSSIGDTLFGMYNTLAIRASNIYNVIFAGPVMLERAGVPSFITTFVASLMAFVVAFDVMSYIRGWGL